MTGPVTELRQQSTAPPVDLAQPAGWDVLQMPPVQQDERAHTRWELQPVPLQRCAMCQAAIGALSGSNQS
jgi:hypothetical protein